MAFAVRSTGSNNSNADRPKMSKEQWEDLNKYVVETANLQQPETLVGIVSGIVDVGVQPQPDAQYLFTGTPAEEVVEIEKDPTCRFEDLKDYQDGGKVKRYKLKPVKAAQSVVFAIDFPDIMLDKGKFFGNSDIKPLRLLLGGEFTPAGGKTIAARPAPLSVRKNDKTNNQWSMPFNSTIYKMAVAAKLIAQGEAFLPERVDELLGKALQFKVQVFLNDGKYFTEKCAFAAGLSRGQVAPAYDQSLLHMIQFNDDNKPEALKQLRASVKNTMRNATDFNESKVKDQIGDGVFKKEETTYAASKVEVKDEVESIPFDPSDDSDPFSDSDVSF